MSHYDSQEDQVKSFYKKTCELLCSCITSRKIKHSRTNKKLKMKISHVVRTDQKTFEKSINLKKKILRIYFFNF